MEFVIGIDTSDSKRRSCLVYGPKGNIDMCHNTVSSICESAGVSKYIHWSRFPNKTKDKLKKPISEYLLQIQNDKSRYVRFYVFDHPKPADISEKEHYLSDVPLLHSKCLEDPLKGKHGRIYFECDDDFNVSKVPNGTDRYLDKLFQQLSFRIAGQIIPVRRENALYRATIKKHGKLLELYGRKVSSRESKAVQLADLSLGLAKFYPSGFKFARNAMKIKY